MHRYVQRHRYPKKRNIFRILLLIFLPLLLIGLLIGSSLILSEPSRENERIETPQLGRTIDLPPHEAYPMGPLADSLNFDRLVLDKGNRRLTAYSGGKAVRVYLVALGQNPIGHKKHEGDNRTPEGSYVIDGKNSNSAYYKNLGISYPNEADRARAKKLGKPPGGDIKIHGLAPAFANVGRFHRLTDWTFGCVALTNEEMEELYTRTPVGIPIDILP